MLEKTIPLAERMRPETLDEFIGQEHLTGTGGVLNKAINSGSIPSMILWGPPGVGKTTLAGIIAKCSQRPFYALSAIQSGVKDVRDVLGKSSQQNPSILFIDEIHRFSKSQQDALLGAVEKGIITLIGATTENPSFEVISALLSRCQVYILESHSKKDLISLIESAVRKDPVLRQKNIEVKEFESLLRISGGDARKLLNLFELVVEIENTGKIVITNDIVEKIAQQHIARYDKSGEQHYDIISAFIKSIRGSDPNGALYWLARMIQAGEDPKFIARRLLILSSEDIGIANPNAFLMANACFQSVQAIGFPESRIILSQTVIYLATSAKSNSSYTAINEAMAVAGKTGDLPVPLHLRNAPTSLMKEIGYGEDYRYAHDFQGNFIEQEYLPNSIAGKRFYNPGENPREAELKNKLKSIWKNKYKY